MNEQYVLLLQAVNRLDELTGLLLAIAKDLKSSLDADNAELKSIRDEIAKLRVSTKNKKGQ